MKIIIISIIILLAPNLFAQDNIWDKLDKGNYEVGFEVLSLYDSSRTINNQKNYRPIQISIWYPAEFSSNPSSMKYKDYFLLSATEINFEVSEELKDSAISEYKNLILQNGVNGDAFEYWFNTQMIAQKDCNPNLKKVSFGCCCTGKLSFCSSSGFLV